MMTAQHSEPAAAPATDGLARVTVDALPFVASTVDALADHLCQRAAAGQGGWVVTPNIDILRRWRREAAFRELVSDATIFTADGSPIVWASRLQGTPLPARLPGSDLFVALFDRAARAGLRLALIGGNEGTAERAADLLAGHAGMMAARLARTHCPPLGFERQPEELRVMTQMMLDWQPHIVFVGLGSPKQEQLIRQLRALCPQAWFLGVGVSFSFVAGDVQRAPAWAQRAGLEWLHRLIQEPKRLARRYLYDGLPFAFGLLTRALLKRVCTRAAR
jgi:N-acetylglucosaminyldiphosphoundecaprenol N-acetyl-beta-D-mannosaminyltransferase